MRISNRIVIATTNLDKFEEFQALFAGWPEISLATADQYARNADKLGFVERHDTYLENALAKARLVNMGTHYPTLADDSGLEVEALGNKPGVRSHRYATPKAGMSQDVANVQLLLSELQGKPNRSALFVATLVLMVEGITLNATGILEGTIAEAPRGDSGFGYDPVFIPKGSSKTLAEMTSMEKNAISHRARALQDLMNQLKVHGIVLAKP